MKRTVRERIRRFTDRLINASITQLRNFNQTDKDLLYLIDTFVNQGVVRASAFNFDAYTESIIDYFQSMKSNKPFLYQHSGSVSRPTLYGSVYACLIIFLCNKGHTVTESMKKEWVAFFDSYQRSDGFFVDPTIESEEFYNKDWWGAKHLLLHIVIAYSYLGKKPKYRFSFLEDFYNKEYLASYLEGLEFKEIVSVDSDNTIMNLGCLLQYQRDTFNDQRSGSTLEMLICELEDRINPKWGSWGMGNDDDIRFLSRSQQFAYHLYPLWMYDDREIKHADRLIDLSLKVQNKIGGFGEELNSSACEDLDSIDLLIKLSKLTDYRRDDIRKALEKAFRWVLANQNEDGGFVFKRNQPFEYGHELMSSLKNESNLFATWFRTLSIAYMTDFLSIENEFNIGRCPGYQFTIGNRNL